MVFCLDTATLDTILNNTASTGDANIDGSYSTLLSIPPSRTHPRAGATPLAEARGFSVKISFTEAGFFDYLSGS